MTTPSIKQKVQIVTIAEGKLLLLQFTKERGEGFQNITGGVEYDESFLEGARRELLEEIGIASNLIDVHYSFNFHDRWGNDVEEKVFLFNPLRLPTIHLSAEHQSYKWIAIKEVSQTHFTFPTNYEAFKKALEFVK